MRRRVDHHTMMVQSLMPESHNEMEMVLPAGLLLPLKTLLKMHRMTKISSVAWYVLSRRSFSSSVDGSYFSWPIPAQNLVSSFSHSKDTAQGVKFYKFLRNSHSLTMNWTTACCQRHHTKRRSDTLLEVGMLMSWQIHTEPRRTND